MAENFVATENGNIKISPEVIVKISSISAREVEGVTGLGPALAIGDILGKKAPVKGVKVEITEEATIIDVHITVKFGVKINEIAPKVQVAVRNAVEEFAGFENIVVNVYVDGIELEKTDENSKDKK